jgi:hypothetical protein
MLKEQKGEVTTLKHKLLKLYPGYSYAGRLETGRSFGNIDLIPNTSKFKPSSIVITSKDTEFVIIHDKFYKKAVGITI